jgi:site-specific DNA recombinase
MPSTNGHGPKRAILYARVSTDEQARSGYSLAQQIEALRAYAAREGYEVLEEVVDPGQSGTSLERPGMDRVRDLVAGGGVAVVLAQDRDRFAREPAYHYLLRREFEEHGTKIRAMNDRGDDTPEGELTDGILDQLGKYERAKIVERSRRGKLRKAREGKVIATYRPTHGFCINATRDGYEVDEEKMAVVRRVFRMIGAEGAGIYGVHKTLERDGVPAPGGGKYWDKRAIRRWIVDDAYKPHTYQEVTRLVRPEIAARLEPKQSYGIWWFNRRRTSLTQVSEPSPDGNGRVYRKVEKVAYRNKDEWIAVPIPDAGIPLEWVEAARAMLAECRSPSRVDGRFWELSGALMRCGECERAMEAMVKTARKKSGGKYIFCYYRCREGNRRRETCSNNRCIRSDRAHAAVWGLISKLLSEPERLREGFEAMIEEERKGMRGDPERESKAWLQKLAEVDRKRDGYLELAAEGILGRDELRAKLAVLEETRETAERELHALEGRSELLKNLEREKDAIIERYAGLVPEALEELSPKERHRVYRMLRLSVVAHSDATLEVHGALSRAGLGTVDSLRTS